MKGLVKMMQGKVKQGRTSPKAVISKGFGNQSYKTRFLAYQFPNGFWCVMSCTMWSSFSGVKKVTILGRLDTNRTMGQALGYEKQPSRQKRGRALSGPLSKKGF